MLIKLNFNQNRLKITMYFFMILKIVVNLCTNVSIFKITRTVLLEIGQKFVEF